MPRKPWYNRRLRVEKRLRMSNVVTPSLLKAGRRVAELYSAARGEPRGSIVRRFATSDYTIDIIVRYIEPRPYALIRYITTRSVITPRDMERMWARMRRAAESIVPPGADVTYASVAEDGVHVTTGAWGIAIQRNIMIDRSGGRKLLNALTRYFEARLYSLLNALRRAKRVTMGAGLLAAVLNIINRHLKNLKEEQVEEYELARRIAEGLTPDEAWRLLAPRPPP